MWDFSNLQKVAEFNRDGMLRIAFCSGRPPAFQEALARQLLVASYCICENGALLMHPLTKDLILHPDVPKEFLRKRPEILATLHEMVEGTDIVVEFGKEVLISVNPPDKKDLPDLVEAVGKTLEGLPIQIFNSGRSVEVVPHGVTKDAGLALWAEIEKVPVEEVTSIGDADNDLDILKAAGKAAAPANCTPAVRSIVGYVSEYPMVAGVVDILSKIHQGAL
jgi:HAD superfamily hydrolase (TIGR01484 family)